MTSHEDWLEQKAQEEDELRYERELRAEKERLKKQHRRETSEALYQQWLENKENYEKACTLLWQLDGERCRVDEDWFEVAVALNAVDCLRGVYKQEEYAGLPVDRNADHNASSEEMKKRRTLEQEFYKWSRKPGDGHEFRDVHISKEKAKTFTATAQNMMEEYAEDALRLKGQYVQASLKYSIPKVQQKAHDKRNLFNPDTSKYNAIFSKMCRAEYFQAQKEMYKRLDEGCDSGRDLASQQRRILYKMGIIRLAKWIEADRISNEDGKREQKRKEKEDAINMHEMFVAKKERYRLRIPESLLKENGLGKGNRNRGGGRMNYSMGHQKTYRSKLDKAAPKGTLEIVTAGGCVSGKYIYCRSQHDLDLAREQLKEMGYLYKENFKDEDGDPLLDEYYAAKKERKKKMSNSALSKSKERKEKAKDTFEDWSKQKEMRISAVEALQHTEKPGTGGRGRVIEENHWRYVGEQLKAIDVSLIKEFTEWSKGYKSPGECNITWESLPPNRCDTCSPSTDVHKVLLKFLNKPGRNFKNIFDLAVDSRLAKMMRSDGRSVGEETAEEREKVENTLALNPQQFINLMRDAGIAVQPQEVRILTSLFDQDGDGLVSREEFLAFTGLHDRPNVRGESLQILRGGKFCVWEACCHVTGLNSAYEIVRDNNFGDTDDEYSSDEGEMSKTLEETEDEDSDKKSNDRRRKGSGKGVKITKTELQKPLLLRSGKKKKGWIRLPLPDLLKRAQRLLASEERNIKEFRSKPPKRCEFSKWTNKERATALAGLQALAEKNREISKTLRLETNGKPPAAPILQISPGIYHADEKSRQTTLPLLMQAEPGTLRPAFYILECAGPEGSKTHRQHEYHEICRDPPNASSLSKQKGPKGEFLMHDLLPGTRYYFRLRAFNGFGASSYTYASFATGLLPPKQPRIVSSNATTVTISWARKDASKAKTNSQELTKRLLRTFNSMKERNNLVHVQDWIQALTLNETPDGGEIFLLEERKRKNNIQVRLIQNLNEEKRAYISWDVIYSLLEQMKEEFSNHLKNGDSESDSKVRSTLYVLCKCVSDEEVHSKVAGKVSKDKTISDVVYSVLKSSHWYVNQASSKGSLSTLDVPEPQYIEIPQAAKDCIEKPAMRIVLPRSRVKDKLQSKKKPGSYSKGEKEKNIWTKQIIGSFNENISHVEVYEQIYVGYDEQCSISSLMTAESYQFRVIAINRGPVGGADEVAGSAETRMISSRMSQPLILHSNSEKPPAPRVARLMKGGETSITTDSVRLCWGFSVNGSKSSENKKGSKTAESTGSITQKKGDDWRNVLADWTNDPRDEVRGSVSESTIRKTFMRYDLDANGTIEGEELDRLFEDLGLPIRTANPNDSSSLRFKEALQKLDTNGDGKINYQEFSAWFRNKSQSFVLLHRTKDINLDEMKSDTKLRTTNRSSSNGSKRTPDWSVVYRGEDTEADISGLEPNTLHCFALQTETNKNISDISKEIVIMTAPEIPQQPVIVECSAKKMRVKWYPGHGGADRYVLEAYCVESLDDLASSKKKQNISGKKNNRKKQQDKWQEVYNGKLTMAFIDGLQRNSVYRLRVRAVNAKGLRSESSLIAQVTTDTSEKKLQSLHRKSNAATYFDIECTGDVVVGDTILFSERVFEDQSKANSLFHGDNASVTSLSQQSVSSFDRADRRRLRKKVYVSERTVAARVVNQRKYLDRARDLILEVIWSSLSVKDAPEEYLLSAGARITRSESEMFKFETFRARWVQEDQRWSYNEERDADIA